MVVVLLKVLLAVAIVPLLITLYLASAERLKTQEWYRRWIVNWAFLALVVAVAAASTLEVWSYRQSTPSGETERPLRFLPLEAYEKELDSIQQKPSDWAARKQELIRKFQFADYAYDRHDYQKSIDALSELEKGEDALGPLFHVPSYIVANDLACAYFRRQRNRGFFASRYLALAQSRVPPNSTEVHALEENLAALDELVNRLD